MKEKIEKIAGAVIVGPVTNDPVEKAHDGSSIERLQKKNDLTDPAGIVEDRLAGVTASLMRVGLAPWTRDMADLIVRLRLNGHCHRSR